MLWRLVEKGEVQRVNFWELIFAGWSLQETAAFVNHCQKHGVTLGLGG